MVGPPASLHLIPFVCQGFGLNTAQESIGYLALDAAQSVD